MIVKSALLLSCTALCVLGLATTASGARYTVNGLVLGARIARDSASYRAYECKKSEDFEDYTYCERTERRNTSLGQGRLSSVIIHGSDGTAIYLMTDLAPVKLDRQAIENEIIKFRGNSISSRRRSRGDLAATGRRQRSLRRGG